MHREAPYHPSLRPTTVGGLHPQLPLPAQRRPRAPLQRMPKVRAPGVLVERLRCVRRLEQLSAGEHIDNIWITKSQNIRSFTSQAHML